jgi:hypothetical protein
MMNRSPKGNEGIFLLRKFMQVQESSTKRPSVRPFIAHPPLVFQAVFRENVFEAPGKLSEGIDAGPLTPA